jgi:hypothetical protein
MPNMPLLEVMQSRQISASIRLDEATAAQVDQYAAFIRATADDVVEKALSYVFSKDREFQEFLRTPAASKVSPTLRIRKLAQPVVASESERKPVAAMPVPQDAGVRSVAARA